MTVFLTVTSASSAVITVLPTAFPRVPMPVLMVGLTLAMAEDRLPEAAPPATGSMNAFAWELDKAATLIFAAPPLVMIFAPRSIEVVWVRLFFA